MTSGSDEDIKDEQWFPNQLEAMKNKQTEEKNSAKKEKLKPGKSRSRIWEKMHCSFTFRFVTRQ